MVSAPGVEYAYRMVVNFTDGTNIVADCVEVSGETFKWLGDLKWISYSSGYLSPVVDRGIENNNVIVNGQTYYKQVGNHAAGYLEYKLDSLIHVLSAVLVRLMPTAMAICVLNSWLTAL